MSNFKSSEILSKIDTGKTVVLSFHYPTEDVIKSLNSLFANILAKNDLIYLVDTIITATREIIINAVKANAKRIYFDKMRLDIKDKFQYQEGILQFKNSIVGNLEVIENDLKQSEYKVFIAIKRIDGGFKISVINNTPILPEELERVRLRMDKAKEYNDFTDAYEDVYDSTEGAGLGIVLVSLLLKNSGISLDSFKITSDGKSTQCQMIIPKVLKPVEIITSVRKEIMEQVQGLPTFPDNIVQLQRLCHDPESNISDIAQRIMVDPALTSDVIKLANSAGFLTVKRTESINEAVMTIGLKNLNSILMTTSARKILDKRFKKFEQIWEHCNRVAYYARNIALKFRLFKIVENVYLAGLLHDFGKIVLLSTNLELTNWIADTVNDRKIRTSTVLEEISIGISHSTIGELIARRWNFPEFLVEAVRLHHSPLMAGPDYKDIVYVLCGIEKKKYHYNYLEDEVLERFSIQEPTVFQTFHTELQARIVNESK
jgi:HD-like signal output (HDOD) protein